jgi:parallel beta-helix repeat protein
MEKKIMLLTVLMLVFLTVLPYFETSRIVGLSLEATMQVEPKEFEKFVCETFEINITVTDVDDLYFFEFYLNYDPEDTNRLEVLEAEKDDVFRFCKLFEQKPEEIERTIFSIDPNENVIRVSCAQAETGPVSGDVTLATIKFKCTGIGQAFVTISRQDTILMDEDWNEIDTEDAWCIIKIKEMQDKQIEVDQNYTLCTDVFDFFGEHLFNIEANNTVLDLNGHTINNIDGVGYAVEVKRKNNVTIKNGVITNWQYGIEIADCHHINIINITFSNLAETAILVQDSSNVYISNNSVFHSPKECLRLRNCAYSEISYNVFSNNKKYGIVMERNSKNNTIHNNTIKDNSDSGGISVHESSSNLIFSNNFINNTDRNGQTNHVESYKSTNVWNSNYPEGGNYWDDYDKHSIGDKVSGMNGTIPGPDGIGDKEYSISDPLRLNNRDEYPLMNLHDSNLRVFDETYACPVAIYSDSPIMNFHGTSVGPRAREMSFDTNNGTYCKIIIPREVSSGALTVLIDGTTTASILNWDDAHSFIDITYSEGNHKVKIKADIDSFCLSSFTKFPDFDENGLINIIDISAVAIHYGKTQLYPSDD